MSQVAWDRCLRKAAHHGWTLRQAVIAYQNLKHTRAFPSGVTPQPRNDPGLLGAKVAALWPEFTQRPWLAK